MTHPAPSWYIRLKQGVLVACVLNGDFDHIKYATVVSKVSPSLLPVALQPDVKQYCFSVEFLPEEGGGNDSVDTLNSLIQSRNILAVLCPTYYAEFKPVLEALQQRDPEFLPFQEELVHCVWEHECCTTVDTASMETTVPEGILNSVTESPLYLLEAESSNVVQSLKPLIGQYAAAAAAAEEEEEEEKALSGDELNRQHPIKCNSIFSKPSNKILVPYSPTYKHRVEFNASMNFRQLQRLPFQRSEKYQRTFLPSFIEPGKTEFDWRVIFKNKVKDTDLSPDTASSSTDFPSLQSANFGVIRQMFASDLDESQLDAVELALHNRVTVIQGPPGTGKTFIGYKLIELLLSVSTLPKRPILVLACKNHILNEFLKGCGEFCATDRGKVIRVGGRKQELANTVDHLSDLCPSSKGFGEHQNPTGQFRDICDVVPMVIEHLSAENLLLIITTQNDEIELSHLANQIIDALQRLPDDVMKSSLLKTARKWPDIYRSEQSPYLSIIERYMSGTDHLTEDNIAALVSDVIAPVYAIRSIAVQMVHWFSNDQVLQALLTQQYSPSDDLYSELKEAFVNYDKVLDEDDQVDNDASTMEHGLQAGVEEKQNTRKRVYFSDKKRTNGE